MRRARIKEAGAVYHCVSRTVGGQFLLDDLAKQRLVDLLFPLAQFCGVEIITYCMMSNHFHLLIRIPPADTCIPDSV
ncbi:MAG: transposase, partial [Verrucomicrobia bacterium]|nr:transposase [Verrucomicrobiota bacterium]